MKILDSFSFFLEGVVVVGVLKFYMIFKILKEKKYKKIIWKSLNFVMFFQLIMYVVKNFG